MILALRWVMVVFATYRLASMLSSEEGPYLGFYQPKGMGVFDWIRMRLGAYDYAPNGEAATSLGRGISCPLCTGVYIALVMVVLALWASWPGDIFIFWMGVSGAQVFLENLTSDEAIEGAIEEVAESLEE